MNPVVMIFLIIGAICIVVSVVDVVAGGDLVEIGVLGLVFMFIAFVVDVVGRAISG